MNDFLLESQKEKVRNARVNGEVVSGIIDCLKENDGMIDRKTLLPFLSDVLGLTDEESEVLHIVEQEDGTITKRNYFHSVVDYTLTDMKNGVFGNNCVIEIEDGLWIHEDIHALDSLKVKQIAKFSGIKDSKKRKAALIKEICTTYSNFLSDKKQIFKRKNGNKENILKIVEKNTCTVEDAFNIFFGQ